ALNYFIDYFFIKNTIQGVLLSKERATSESRTSFGVLYRVACPLFAELLGCVKWQKKFSTSFAVKLFQFNL
ncbi:hypothetical protein ACFL0B_00760, partial [Thermodesulfobacteriota bacterium]